jgi:CBS-domain-containing membrane protein
MAEQKRLRALKAALEEITAMGDEARLQLNLLTAQARDKRDELGTSIENLEHRVDRSIDQAVHRAAGRTKRLTRSFSEFLVRHSPNGKAQIPIRSIMSQDLRCCRIEDTLTAPAQIMWDVDCGAVPVLDAADKLCGIITDRDICMAAYTQGLPLWKIRVADVMTQAVHTCRLEQSVADAAETMVSHQVRRVPIVDGHGHALGIVALADIVRHAPALGLRVARSLTFKLISSVSQPPPRGLRLPRPNGHATAE